MTLEEAQAASAATGREVIVATSISDREPNYCLGMTEEERARLEAGRADWIAANKASLPWWRRWRA